MYGFFDFSTDSSCADSLGLYSPGHILWLAAALLIWLGLCRGYRRAGAPARRLLLRLTAGTALALELLRAALLFSAGQYGLGRLPLHLCALAVYISFYHSLLGGKLTGQFLYAFCMPGAFCALLFPDWSYYPAFHFMSVSSFILHILLVGYTLMQVAGGDIRPDIRRAPACLGIMLLTALPVYIFDRLTDTNYMFLNWPSPGSPLEWFSFLGRPGYLLGYLPLLAAVWAVIYAPFLARRGPPNGIGENADTSADAYENTAPIESYACYDYGSEWYLVEMLLDVSTADIDWDGFGVYDAEGVKISGRQCVYMEQYLTAGGTEKLCGTYSTPAEPVRPCRVAFFIYKTASRTLQTPYGDIELKSSGKAPERLKGVIDFV